MLLKCTKEKSKIINNWLLRLSVYYISQHAPNASLHCEDWQSRRENSRPASTGSAGWMHCDLWPTAPPTTFILWTNSAPTGVFHAQLSANDLEGAPSGITQSHSHPYLGPDHTEGNALTLSGRELDGRVWASSMTLSLLHSCSHCLAMLILAHDPMVTALIQGKLSNQFHPRSAHAHVSIRIINN